MIALGCQYDGGGSFEPGKGMAWRLFSTSLALFPDLLTLADSLVLLQAMTAMAVYAFGISCIAIEHVIISEAARRAQRLSSTNLPDSAMYTYQRTFWTLYSMEKISSFYFGRSSVSSMSIAVRNLILTLSGLCRWRYCMCHSLCSRSHIRRVRLVSVACPARATLI